MPDPKSEHFTNQNLAELVTGMEEFDIRIGTLIEIPYPTEKPWLGEEIAHRLTTYEVVTSKLRQCCAEALTGGWLRTDAGFRKMIEAIDDNLNFTKDKEKRNVLELCSDASSTEEDEEGKKSKPAGPDSEG